MNDPASKYFKCTDRERAIFEAGIKLGAIYHQYTGIPVNESNIEYIQKAIESATMLQPFVENVKVKINLNAENDTKFNYKSLNGTMLEVDLTVNYNGSTARAKMKYLRDLNYPLMYLEE
ncbi:MULTISPECIES: dihydroneopterin aldolase family protein [Acidiplasma]|jgi:hypothetical protein|uniref:Dihydroneopterin aldolase n=2 Tax=Acidiplasma TaxID=507753 RepID=A0A0Q0XJ95_9ARCH|nr:MULTISPECIES: dihydroneopterin aldolase family protein [Acidiplasma]KQB34593.1 dihydroneopterin aldolase [Acidiplasma aeolicum]KQB34952.1 dihydroneopterin aldolase [Acidiplasma cupricumulans]